MLSFSSLRFGRAYLFGLFAIALIGWGLYAAVDMLRPPSDIHLRLGAGSSAARRFQIAEALVAEARDHDLFIDAVPTKGFEDSIQKLHNSELELAMVSSGLETAACSDLRVLAGLDLAPLHILARRQFVEEGLSLTQIIKGRRVNLGPAGTNDCMLGSDVVRFLRLTPMNKSGQGDYIHQSLSKEELAKFAAQVRTSTGSERQAALNALPDVVMTVVSLPSVLVQSLLDTGEYCLVPFSNVEPYLISELHHVKSREGGIDRIFLEPATIHAGMYLGDSLQPTKDLATVGMRTILLAKADSPASAIERVMRSVFETDFTKRIRPVSPRELASIYPIHSSAEAYLDRDQPLLTGSFFETISKFLSIFGAFSAGALSLYGYLRRRRIRQPGEYLEEIRKIDALASNGSPESEAPLSSAVLDSEIHSRLNQLKEQVIRDYCDNRVQGEMVLLSILSTLADSRTRLHASAARSAGLPAVAPHSPVRRTDVPELNQSPNRASRAA